MEAEFKPQIYGFWENLHQFVKYLILISFAIFAYITYNQPGSELRNLLSTIMLIIFFFPIAMVLFLMVKSGLNRITKTSGKVLIIIFDIFFVILLITVYQQAGGEDNQIAAIIALGSLLVFPVFSLITFNLSSTKEYFLEKEFQSQGDSYVEF